MASIAKKSIGQVISYRDQIKAFKDLVRDALPIDQAIESMAGVAFSKRSGSTSKTACCPFHNERSPSFSVNPQAGYYRCFGSGCGAHGDVFTFIMDFYNVPFMEALAMAGRQVGMEMPEPDGKPARKGAKPVAMDRSRPRINERGAHPSDLKDHALIPVPEKARRPRANLVAKGWHEGNSETPAGTRFYRPKMVHEYRNAAGQLLLSILRLEFMKKEDGVEKRIKIFMPFRLAELPDGAPSELLVDRERRLGWLVRSVMPGSRRPVYGMEGIPEWSASGGRNVLIVEGEKTADAARRLLRGTAGGEGWLVLSPLGGSSSALHADWSDLAGAISDAAPDPVRVLVWPDADTPITRPDGEVIDRQAKYGKEIVNGLAFALARDGLAHDRASFTRISPIAGLTHGWDLADAETEGWTADRVFAKISEEGIRLEPEAQYLEANRPVREEADDPVPFDHDETAIGIRIWDDLMREADDKEAETMSQTTTTLEHTDLDPISTLPVIDESALRAAAQETPARSDVRQVTELTEEEVVAPDEGGNIDLIRDAQVQLIMDNRYFRCLGYEGGCSYFMSMLSGQVFELNPATMRSAYFIHLAPGEWWVRHFQTAPDRNGNFRTDWDAVANALVKATYRVGQYKAENQAGQGAWLDFDRVVFNNGRGLWVENKGPVMIQDFRGEKNYISGRFCGMPDFDNPFPENAPEILELFEIISSLNWAPETRNVSILNLFGWLAIGPLCGILPWRPHMWLSGERGVGKSWIINNIINPIFREYGVNVKADSTESGLRNLLNMHAFPLIFDEAEGETIEDRNRMSKIIRLARHSADPGKSVVAQGVPGGKGQRQYAIASTFLMCSITPQLSAAADQTRFGRAHLLSGLNHYDFVEKLEEPAARLLTPEFSSRMMARMIMHGARILKVCPFMFSGLDSYGLERRLIDVYGTYLAGAWVLLRDDIPESGAAAMAWARETFNMLDGLVSQANEVSEDKDHVRLFHILFSTDIRVESLSLGLRTYSLTEIVQMAVGAYGYEDSITSAEATRSLGRIGIRLGVSMDKVMAQIPAAELASMTPKERSEICARIAKPTDVPDCLLIHKKSSVIERFLEKTPYATNYADVMVQAKGVRKGGSIHFIFGNSRFLEVPLEMVSLGEEMTDGGNEQVRGE